MEEGLSNPPRGVERETNEGRICLLASKGEDGGVMVNRTLLPSPCPARISFAR